MRRCLLALLILLCWACKPTETPDAFQGKLDSLFAIHKDFSGVVLVARQGKPALHRAFGLRDVEAGIPNDTTTLFELASVSKQFTAMVIMMLKEEGKLNYDDPLAKYLPEIPYPGITIRHLLTHTSGLPDYQEIMDQNWDKNKVAGNLEIIQYLIAYHPPKLFEPGEKYEYSNTGYVLLGSVAEVASGKDFIEFARERIFKPVGMTSTDIRTLEAKAAIENFAKPYVYMEETKRYVRADSFPSSNYIVWLGARKGPGRVSSTARDMLRWDRVLYETGLISKESLTEAYSPYKLNNDSLSRYGFGWRLDEKPGLGRKIWHTGSNPGYSTRIARYPDVDNTVIILSNNEYPRITELDKAIDFLLTRK